MASCAAATDVSVNLELGNPQSLSVSATVSTQFNVGEMQICDGTCDYTKSIDSATQFTVKVAAVGDDLNANGFAVYFYETSDTNDCSEGWDCVKKLAITGGSANGCEQAGDTYCLTVESTDWTTKFLAGATDVWVSAKTNGGATDSNESVGAITVNSATSLVIDSSTATYSTAPNSTQNPILTDQANAYVYITHNGNIDLNLTTQGADFIKGGDTIDKANQKFSITGDYGGSAAIDGTAQNFLTVWGRGTYPTSSAQNLYFWLDCPSNTAAGDYTSTTAIEGVAS